MPDLHRLAIGVQPGHFDRIATGFRVQVDPELVVLSQVQPEVGDGIARQHIGRQLLERPAEEPAGDALHGEPLVCSADDALDTFERSELPHLALGRWMISKA